MASGPSDSPASHQLPGSGPGSGSRPTAASSRRPDMTAPDRRSQSRLRPDLSILSRTSVDRDGSAANRSTLSMTLPPLPASPPEKMVPPVRSSSRSTARSLARSASRTAPPAPPLGPLPETPLPTHTNGIFKDDVPPVPPVPPRADLAPTKAPVPPVPPRADLSKSSGSVRRRVSVRTPAPPPPVTDDYKVEPPSPAGFPDEPEIPTDIPDEMPDPVKSRVGCIELVSASASCSIFRDTLGVAVSQNGVTLIVYSSSAIYIAPTRYLPSFKAKGFRILQKPVDVTINDLHGIFAVATKQHLVDIFHYNVDPPDPHDPQVRESKLGLYVNDVIHGLAISPDGKVLAVAHDSGIDIISLVDTDQRRSVICGPTSSISFSLNGRTILATGAFSKTQSSIILSASDFAGPSMDGGLSLMTQPHMAWISQILFPEKDLPAAQAALVPCPSVDNTNELIAYDKHDHSWGMFQISSRSFIRLRLPPSDSLRWRQEGESLEETLPAVLADPLRVAVATKKRTCSEIRLFEFDARWRHQLEAGELDADKHGMAFIEPYATVELSTFPEPGFSFINLMRWFQDGKAEATRLLVFTDSLRQLTPSKGDGPPPTSTARIYVVDLYKSATEAPSEEKKPWSSFSLDDVDSSEALPSGDIPWKPWNAFPDPNEHAIFGVDYDLLPSLERPFLPDTPDVLSSPSKASSSEKRASIEQRSIKATEPRREAVRTDPQASVNAGVTSGTDDSVKQSPDPISSFFPPQLFGDLDMTGTSPSAAAAGPPMSPDLLTSSRAAHTRGLTITLGGPLTVSGTAVSSGPIGTSAQLTSAGQSSNAGRYSSPDQYTGREKYRSPGQYTSAGLSSSSGHLMSPDPPSTLISPLTTSDSDPPSDFRAGPRPSLPLSGADSARPKSSPHPGLSPEMSSSGMGSPSPIPGMHMKRNPRPMTLQPAINTSSNSQTARTSASTAADTTSTDKTDSPVMMSKQQQRQASPERSRSRSHSRGPSQSRNQQAQSRSKEHTSRHASPKKSSRSRPQSGQGHSSRSRHFRDLFGPRKGAVPSIDEQRHLEDGEEQSDSNLRTTALPAIPPTIRESMMPSPSVYSRAADSQYAGSPVPPLPSGKLPVFDISEAARPGTATTLARAKQDSSNDSLGCRARSPDRPPADIPNSSARFSHSAPNLSHQKDHKSESGVPPPVGGADKSVAHFDSSDPAETTDMTAATTHSHKRFWLRGSQMSSNSDDRSSTREKLRMSGRCAIM